MVRSCCAYNCTNRWGQVREDGSNLPFHKFPLQNRKLLKKWTLAVNREGFVPVKSSVLCSCHFKDEDYRSSSRRYLKVKAVPSVFNFHQTPPKKSRKQLSERSSSLTVNLTNMKTKLQNKSHKQSDSSEESSDESSEESSDESSERSSSQTFDHTNTETEIQSKDHKQLSERSSSPTFHLTNTETELCTLDTTMPDDKPTSCTPTEAKLQRKVKFLEAEIRKLYEIPDIANSKEVVCTLNTSMTDDEPTLRDTTAANLRRKVKILQDRIRRRDQKICYLESLLSTTEAYCGMSTNTSEELRNNFDELPFEFIVHQIKNKPKTKCGERYSAAMKDFAITLYSLSPQSYKYMRTKFNLPSPSLVRSWVSTTYHYTGYLDEEDLLKFNEVTAEND